MTGPARDFLMEDERPVKPEKFPELASGSYWVDERMFLPPADSASRTTRAATSGSAPTGIGQ